MCWTSLGYGSCALQTQVSKTTAPLRFKLLPPGNGQGTKFMQIGQNFGSTKIGYLNIPTWKHSHLTKGYVIHKLAGHLLLQKLNEIRVRKQVHQLLAIFQSGGMPPPKCTGCPGNASLPDMPSPWGSGASACQRERWCNVNTGDCSFKCHPPWISGSPLFAVNIELK